ncbi:MAG: asparagine synthase C-terminal domain-containing protein [Candidatus Bilamarchaeaceae archaeon]
MIPELSSLLRDSILHALEDRVAIAFSGGIDSSLIAQVAKDAAKTELYTAGVKDCQDMEYAEKVATLLNLPLVKCVMDENEIVDVYRKCYNLCPNVFLKVELLVPIYRIANEARARGHGVLLFGSGSEELFVGYERYYTYAKKGGSLDELLKEEYKTLQSREIAWIKKICRHFDIEARFPFYNNKLAQFVFSIPLELRMEEYELKKGVLREAAAFLGVPEIAIKRKKKALQYGSGIHKALIRQKCLPGMINNNL